MWPREREVSQLPEIEELKVGMSLDASGVESGAQRAEKALEGVADTAEQSGERSASGISEINRAILEASRMVTAQMKEISQQLGTATQSIQQTGQVVSGIGERMASAGAASKKAAQGTKEVENAMQALGLSAQVSDRRMAEINEEMQTLADQKRVMESQGYGLGFADYDRIIQRMNELKEVQAEYRRNLTQPATVNVDTSQVTNLSAQLKQAQQDLKSLANVGFGFGDANYDEQYQEALKKLKTVVNINNLCDLGWDQFESCKDVIMDDTLIRRARHAVYENARTIRAVNALRVNNIRRFGALMNESHASLRDDYEVSCPEIDFLVETAQSLPGTIGSRMTGGGFGGCTVSLFEEASIPEFKEKFYSGYKEKYGLEAAFYVVDAGDGVRELPLE